MRPKAIAFALLIAAVAAINNQGPAQACSCVEYPLEDAISSAEAIFTATVLDTQRTGLGEMAYWAMTVDVDQYWKGVFSDPMILYTSENDGLCGLLVYPGEHYLFFAYGSPGAYWIGLCSYNTAVAYAGDILAQLGPPVSVQTSSSSWGRVKSIYR